jgi:hypothetical protein
VNEALYEWTLPFSPTQRRWTDTGSGAWRYDYRSALVTNREFQQKLQGRGMPDLESLLRQRDREYQIMLHYLDAQRTLAETGNVLKAAGIIAAHPATWSLLLRRVTGRFSRAIAQALSFRTQPSGT